MKLGTNGNKHPQHRRPSSHQHQIQRWQCQQQHHQMILRALYLLDTRGVGLLDVNSPVNLQVEQYLDMCDDDEEADLTSEAQTVCVSELHDSCVFHCFTN